MKETFKLHNVALYAKGWYHKSNLINDLRYCLSADSYVGECMNENDIMQLILTHCQRLTMHPPFVSLVDFASGICDQDCWKYGYYTTTNNSWLKIELKEYNINYAILHYCLSNLMTIDPKDLNFIDGIIPDYVTCLPRKESISNEKIKEIFPNWSTNKIELEIIK